MKLVSKIMKVGGSYAVIIPRKILEEMDLVKGNPVLLQMSEKKLIIQDLNAILDKTNNNYKGGHYVNK